MNEAVVNFVHLIEGLKNLQMHELKYLVSPEWKAETMVIVVMESSIESKMN